MKTANADAVPQQWSDILDWLGAGEEVEIRRDGAAVARVIPLPERQDANGPVWPNFEGRARRIWGVETAGGTSLAAALLRERDELA